MEKIKVRVNSLLDSNSAQELLVSAGYRRKYNNFTLHNGWVCFDSDNNILCVCSSQAGKELDDYKEITLQELRDMVVLKRNDPKDANVYQDGDIPCLYDLYLTGSKELYFYHCGKKAWILSNLNHDKDYYELLKPIKGEVMKESLNDKIATAEVARQESKTIDATLAERQSQYGNFEDVAFVTENIMATLAKVRSNGLQDLPHTHRMALYMIASKMARIVNGDFNHLDSWHDIGGYSKLIEDLITLDQ